MYIKRRNGEHARIKRSSRKPRSNESFFSTFGTSFKVLAIWAVILMLDFFTDFRFEFLYSCWLFVRTVIDSFRYQGLAFALFFTLISMTSDLVCYFLIPTTMVHLLGSSIVWIQLVWQPDRGIYGPTVVMCFLFIYVEIAVRVRDPKSFPWGIDICRPFAAHCIGYPAVTLGFVLKTMVSHHFRVRRQRSVEAQNITFFALLEEALPKELRMYLKSDESRSKSKHSLLSTEEQCAITSNSPPSASSRTSGIKDKHINRKHLVNNVVCSHSAALCLPDGRFLSEDAATIQQNLGRPQAMAYHSSVNYAPDSVDLDRSPSRDVRFYPASCHETDIWSSEVDAESSQPSPSTELRAPSDTESKHDSHLDKISSPTAVNGNPCCTGSGVLVQRQTGGCRTRGGLKCAASAETQTVSASVTNSGGPSKVGAGSAKPIGTTNKGSQKDEYTLKLEVELKQLKSELQNLRSSEINLRTQVQQLTAAERTYRSESSQARQEAEVLQTKINQLTQRLETDQASLQNAEKRLVEERKQRTSLEQQLSTQQQQQGSKPGTKGRKDLGPTSADSASPCQTKGANAKISQGTNTTSECCPLNGESCIVRLKSLETELHTLQRDLSLKESQLAALSESQTAAEHSAGMAAAAAQSDRKELMTRLQALQEENQRMTKTLKDEDKMKQELMTAYHTALKEITELNSSLTKKEYQIVELNARLERLTPHMVNAMTNSSTACPTSVVNSVPDSTPSSSYVTSSYLPDSRYEVMDTGSGDANCRRAMPDTNSIYTDGRLPLSSASTNGCTSLTNYSDTSSTYPQSLLNSGFFPNVPQGITSDVLNHFTQYSRYSNGSTPQTNPDFIGSNATNFSFVDDTLSNHLFVQPSPFALRSPGSTHVKHFESRGNPTHQTLNQHRPSGFPRFKPFFAPPTNRSMPSGSATVPTCSPPPYPSNPLRNPGPCNNRIPLHASSYSRDFRRPHSSSQLGNPSLEVVVTSAALLCSGLDLCLSNQQSPPSLNNLVGPVSPLGVCSTSSPLPTAAGLLDQLRPPHTTSSLDLTSPDTVLMTTSEMPIPQLVNMMTPANDPSIHDDPASDSAVPPNSFDYDVGVGKALTQYQQQQQQLDLQSNLAKSERTAIRHSPNTGLLESSRS